MSGLTDKQCLSPWRTKRLIVPGIVALAAVALIPLAGMTFVPIKQFLSALPIARFFSTAGQFGGVTATIGIVLIIWCLDRERRHLVAYYLVALLIAGNSVGIIKRITGRIRPEDSVGLSARSAAKVAAKQGLSPEDAKQLTTDRWLWMGPSKRSFSDEHASFPSGHACSVFVATAFLCVLYRQARWLWMIAAIGAALSRVKFERHFPEDIMVGGAIGWATAMWVFSWCWPMVVGRKIESRITGWVQARQSKSG